MSDASEPLAKLLQEIAALQRSAQESLQSLQAMEPVRVGASEKTCVHSDDKLKLYRYAPLARSNKLPPLLICYAMVNRPYMLDLQPDRSLIRELLLSGMDVYLIDWGYPDAADAFTSLSDYISGYLGRCVDFILGEHGIAALNLLGVCQGGTLSLCYAALCPHQIANLIVMVTPVDFKTPENLLSKWAQNIDMQALTQSGNVAGEFLNLVFLALRPFQLMQQKYADLLQSSADPLQLEHFMRMEKWIFDSPDQPARAFREFVQWFYQENRLVLGTLRLAEQKVELQNIKQPILNIYAAKDHLVPPSASIALGAFVGSEDYQSLAVDAGHIGMYVSSKAHTIVPTAVTAWLRDRRA